MRYKTSKSSEQNFWVSYADLMAGLLFVFILLIGAIVVRYVYTQTNLANTKQNLEEQKRMLSLKEEELAQKKRDFLRLSSDMNVTSASLQLTQEMLTQKETALSLSEQEMENLKKLLADTQTERDATQQSLVQSEESVKLKDDELTRVSKKLLETEASHQQLVEDLNITKTRIKNLTGIRLKVIQDLKAKLGNKINIDPNSGAIRLPSSVLFTVDSFELRPEAKKQLQETLKPYLETLLNDEAMRENIDRIVIEGHTDSDGSYIHNLDLSQKRAYAVLAFIYSWDEKQNALLQKYLSANGRSYSDRVFKNGVEDKEASRRIEIKFSISNKKAIEELETFLQKKE